MTLETILVSAGTAGVISAAGAIWVQSQRERHEDRTRFIDLRRERYSTMLRDADEHVRTLRQQFDAVMGHLSGEGDDEPPALGSTDRLGHLAAEMALLGRRDEVGKAAHEPYCALVSLGRFAWKSGTNAQWWVNTMDKPMDAALAEYDSARERF